MKTHHHSALTVCALAFAAIACSRQSPESRAAGGAPPLTPAAGTATAGRGPVVPQRCLGNFDAFDENGDGRVSHDEFGARPHAHPDPDALFRERDRDGDGRLTSAEFCSGFRAAPGPGARAASPRRPGPTRGMHRGGPEHMGGRMMGGHMMGAHCEQHFDVFDADRDGKVSKDEFGAWPHARGDAETLFEERDTDRDGTLTREEFCSVWRGGPRR